MSIPPQGVRFEAGSENESVLTVTSTDDNGVHLALSEYGYTAADMPLSEYDGRRLADLLATHYGLYAEHYREMRALEHVPAPAHEARTVLIHMQGMDIPVPAPPRLPEVGDWARVTVDNPYSANLRAGQRVQVVAREHDVHEGPIATVLNEGTGAHWQVNARDHLTLAAPPVDYTPEPPAVEPDMAAFMAGESESPFSQSCAPGDIDGDAADDLTSSY